MLNLPVIDTHLHLWDPRQLRYPWLDEAPAINQAHLPADYRAATTGIPIAKMIFVQCEVDVAQYREEVAWVTKQAALDDRIKGIVAWAPLEHGDAVRGELANLARNPLLRGIRRIIQFEADPAFCLRPDFVRGVRLLPEFNLHFEICIKGDEQFRNALALVRQCPKVRFMLDHIGKPFIKEKIMEPWATCIRELAALPNAWCKLSGLANEAQWHSWQPDDCRPYVEQVLDCFGFDRVAFGGDWPVCTLATTYNRWFTVLADIVKGAGENNLKKLFHDTAATFYRI